MADLSINKRATAPIEGFGQSTKPVGKTAPLDDAITGLTRSAKEAKDPVIAKILQATVAQLKEQKAAIREMAEPDKKTNDAFKAESSKENQRLNKDIQALGKIN